MTDIECMILIRHYAKMLVEHYNMHYDDIHNAVQRMVELLKIMEKNHD